VDGVGAGQEAALAIFEPLGEDLVAADLVCPEVGGDAVEVLSGVDADAPTVGGVLDLGDGAVALATETADGVVEIGRAHQVQVDKLLTKVGQLEKHVAVFGEGNAWKIMPQETCVPISVGGRIQDGIHVCKYRHWVCLFAIVVMYHFNDGRAEIRLQGRSIASLTKQDC